jgi:hypothetical protein
METQEIRELLKKSEDDLLSEWFNSELEAEVGGNLPDLAGKTPDLKKLFRKWSKDNLAELICVQWDYCQKRKSYGRTIELVTQLGQFIYTNMKMQLPIPFSLAVLLVMHGFDQFCDCGEGK